MAGKTYTDRILDFFASVKLAIFLFITLAATSIAGTIIPQNQPLQMVAGRYGQKLTTFFYYLDLFDMYHSWWFNILLGCLVLNLTVCSLRRLPKTLKLARPVSGEHVKPDFLKKQPFSAQILRPGSPRDNLSAVKEAVRSRFAKPREIAKPWGILLITHRGAFSRFGAYVIHISLIFIIIGALIGHYRGFKGFLKLAEGQTTNQIFLNNSETMTLPFEVRLDQFSLKRYLNGMPSEYRSDLTIIEQGREVRKASVLVNHPLRYRGVTFYQQSYEMTPAEGWGLRLTRKSDNMVYDLDVRPNRLNTLPDNSGTFLVLGFIENFHRAGPAVKLLIRWNKAGESTVWVSKNRPESCLPREKGPFSFQLINFHFQYSTGLQVGRNPGVGLIWTGCGLLIAGCLVTFFFSHQKLYLGLIPEGSKSRIIMGGSSHRNPDSFKVKFEHLKDRLKPDSSQDKET